MMKRIYFCILILFSGVSFSQVPTCLWANSATGSYNDSGYNIDTDATGNVLVVGNFYSPSITFGSITLNNTGSMWDVYVVKYDPSGTVLWARGGGGTSDDYATGVSTDASGNVYVSGYFKSSTATFGSLTITNSGAASHDLFLLKYNSSGTLLWARSAGGSLDDRAQSVSTDAAGNSTVTGHFFSLSILFGSGSVVNADNTGSTCDMYAATYDASGNVSWSQRAGGMLNDYGQDVAVDGSGNAFVTGYFKSDQLIFGSTTLTNANTTFADMYLVKYNSSGAPVWAVRAGNTLTEYGHSVSTDPSGNVLVVGDFYSSMLSFGTPSVNNISGADAFLVKYDPSGVALWAKSVGGTTDDSGSGVCTDLTGNVYFTGPFYSSALYTSSDTLINSGGADIFIVKYSPSGVFSWNQNFGGNNNDYTPSVQCDAAGRLFLGGSFMSPSVSFGSFILSSTGGYDAFIVKMDVSGVGIAEQNDLQTVLIFPNPTSNDLTVRPFYYFDNATLRLLNVMGELVLEEKTVSGISFTFDVAHLPTGVYFIEINSEKKIARKKFIKN